MPGAYRIEKDDRVDEYRCFGACGASAAQDQVVKSQNRRADGRDMLEVVGDHLFDGFRASVYFSALTLDNAEPPKVL